LGFHCFLIKSNHQPLPGLSPSLEGLLFQGLPIQ
jgi:hypothetical protein